MNVLSDLAFALMLWVGYGDLEYPLHYSPNECSSTQQAPCHPDACLMPAPPPCAPACYPLPPGAPMTMPCPVACYPAGPAADHYEVQVRFPSGPSTKTKPACPQLVAPEDAPVMVPVCWFQDDGGVSSGAALAARLHKVGERCVQLELALHKAGQPKGAHDYSGTQTVPLDTTTCMVLHGAGAEPCRAEVTVRRHIKAPPAPPCCPPMTACVPMQPPAPVYCTMMPPPVPCYPGMPVWNMPPEPTPLPGPCPYAVPRPPSAAYAVPRAPSAAHIHLVRDGGKSRLHMERDEMETTCVRMSLTAGRAGSLAVAAGKERVHVTGKKWKAYADEVEVCDDGRVVLQGNVKLVSDRIGEGASLRAEKVCLRVRNGQFERLITDKRARGD